MKRILGIMSAASVAVLLSSGAVATSGDGDLSSTGSASQTKW